MERRTIMVNRYGLIVLLAAWLVGFGAGCGDVKRVLYAGFDRDTWQQPNQVVHALDIQAGDAIADLGAGGGYFTFRLADAAGPAGRVFAVDVDAEMIDHLSARAQAEGYTNIETVVATSDDALLPQQGVDLVFTCNTYHHLHDRVAYFERLKASLRTGGRVAIIDFDESTWFPNLFGHVTSSADIRAEMEAAGYHLAGEFDFLSKQNFLVFSVQ